MNKIKISNEIAYLIGICGLALAVASVAAANFGVSMIVAPAYVLSRKFTMLTFGQTEYIVQGLIFIVFCKIMGGFRTVFLSSFVNCLIYGAMLDLWRKVIPILNPQITPLGSLPMSYRIPILIFGILLTAASVAVFYKTYLYPQVYDFFVRAVSQHFCIKRLKFKLCFDFTFLTVATIMTLVFFGKLVGVGTATLIMACVTGPLIEFFCKIYDKYFEFVPIFKAFARRFELK